ncbi:MAG: AAA family ATPase [Candidatus Bathyarchaeia archaeon]
MIILIFGPPGAGKTTIARRLAEELDDSYLLSSDQFRRRVYRRLMGEIRRRRGERRHLIVDGTFYKGKWREELRETSGGEATLEVFIDCSLETCLRRNRERCSPIPEEAVHIIWREFERPESPDLEINTDDDTPEEAVQRILSLIRNRA